MLGNQFFMDYSSEFHIIPLSHFHIDFLKPENIEGVIAEHAPDLVINTVAWTNVDSAENPKNHDAVFTINADSPAEIARICEKRKIPFFHISTDFVFSGKEVAIFQEDSPKNPCNVYGKSKAQGEEEVLKYKTSRVFRTAWLYGEYGPNFVQQIVHILKNPPRNGANIKGVNNQWGSPTSCKTVGEVLAQAVRNPDKFPTGIYHAVNDGAVSRLKWIEKIAALVGYKNPIEPVSSDAFVQMAKRPVSSVLKNTKMPALKSWEEALEEYLEANKKG